MVFDEPDGRAIVWSVGNSVERGGWGHDQIETIKRLAPHIRQFARVRHAMANAGALGASLAELLENGRSGFIQLDCRGRILEANDRARDILLKRDGLCDAEGLLTAGIPEEDAELQRVLARALPPCGVQGAGGSMKITRTKACTPLVLEVHPVQGMGRDYRAWDVGALVMVVDPTARPRVDPDLAAAVLGLTPTESRIAVELAAGQTVAGIAEALGCAESTVCTHLKRVYRKQGFGSKPSSCGGFCRWMSCEDPSANSDSARQSGHCPRFSCVRAAAPTQRRRPSVQARSRKPRASRRPGPPAPPRASSGFGSKTELGGRVLSLEALRGPRKGG